MPSTPDLAQIRFQNAMALFDEFVTATVKHPDAATLRGLEGRFAQKLQLQPSYWSQLKGRSRQIGERLARQFEQLCHKPYGWMDQLHSAAEYASGQASHANRPRPTTAAAPDDNTSPQDDDERFIVGLVLTYYRRHPQRARTRLLDLLGEVLTPTAGAAGQVNALPAAATVATRGGNPLKGHPALGAAATAAAEARSAQQQADDEAHALWLRSQAHVAPLKHKK